MTLLIRVVALLIGGAVGFMVGTVLGVMGGAIVAPTSNLIGIVSLLTGPIGAVVGFFYADRKTKQRSRE